MYLAHLRASEDGSHVHYNAFYDPTRHDGPLLPPAASLAPTLWPQFHLRWACPLEAQSGQLESQWRFMRRNCTEMAKVLVLKLDLIVLKGLWLYASMKSF